MPRRFAAWGRPGPLRLAEPPDALRSPRRLTTFVAGIYGPSGVQEDRNMVRIAPRRGEMERGPADRIPGVRVRSRPHQCGDRRILGRMCLPANPLRPRGLPVMHEAPNMPPLIRAPAAE